MAGKKSKAAHWSFLASDDRIKGLIMFEMKKRGWTQKDLAKEMGVQQSRLSCYFNNKPRGLIDVQIVYIVGQLGWDLTLGFEWNQASKDKYLDGL